MSKAQISIITLNKAAVEIGLSTKTLREKAIDGVYPVAVMRKVNGTWMLDIEEWNRWHRTQA